jgi:hypothetical protein
MNTLYSWCLPDWYAGQKISVLSGGSHGDKNEDMTFHVLTAVSMKMTAFLDMVPCSLTEVNQHFRGAYCLHHQGMNKSKRRNRSDQVKSWLGQWGKGGGGWWWGEESVEVRQWSKEVGHIQSKGRKIGYHKHGQREREMKDSGPF